MWLTVQSTASPLLVVVCVDVWGLLRLVPCKKPAAERAVVQSVGFCTGLVSEESPSEQSPPVRVLPVGLSAVGVFTRLVAACGVPSRAVQRRGRAFRGL